LEITSPADGATLDTSPVTVNGTVSRLSATVAVNDEAATVAEDGTFTASVNLTEGENIITVTATLEGQEPVTKTITVTYTPSE
jgi:nitrogen fixation protein FixH